MDREKAQALLLTPPLMTGKFLIRDRIVKNCKVGFTVSFLMPKDFNDATKGHMVQHLTAKEIGAYVKIKENLKFWSLNHLVEHFTKHPITNEGSVKLTMICKDGIHTVSNSSNADSLTIELNESYPYEDRAQNLKVLLLKGFKLHNAVRFQEDKKEFYKADLGTRKGRWLLSLIFFGFYFSIYSLAEIESGQIIIFLAYSRNNNADSRVLISPHFRPQSSGRNHKCRQR